MKHKMINRNDKKTRHKEIIIIHTATPLTHTAYPSACLPKQLASFLLYELSTASGLNDLSKHPILSSSFRTFIKRYISMLPLKHMLLLTAKSRDDKRLATTDRNHVVVKEIREHEQLGKVRDHHSPTSEVDAAARRKLFE